MLQVPDYVAKAMPDVDSWLANLVEGTGLFQGGIEDYVLSLAIAVAFPLVRFALEKTVYDWIARRTLGLPANSKKSDDPLSADQLSTLNKFKESMYKCGVQILFTVVLLIVAIPKPWFSDTKQYWSQCSRLPCETSPSLGERLVYCVELAFYAQGIPGVFLWETKRKDRWELFAHHVATVILIGYSYFLGLTRVGVMVLVCHEANDIFLEAAKLARYAKTPEFVTTIIFVVFMLSWFVTRIYAFGFVVIRSSLFESYDRARLVGANINPHAAILNGFLLFLYVLHVYWSYLILRIAVRQLTTGGAEDIREVEEEEEDEQAALKAKATGKRAAAGLRRRPVGPAALNPAGAASVGDLPGASDM